MSDAHLVQQLPAGAALAYQHLVEIYGPPLHCYLSQLQHCALQNLALHLHPDDGSAESNQIG